MGGGGGGFRPGKCIGENAAAFAYDVYQGFPRKKQTLAVVIDLEDSYKSANGPAHAIILCSQPDTDPVYCRSVPRKNSGDVIIITIIIIIIIIMIIIKIIILIIMLIIIMKPL